jgi:hypothetical protein
VAAPEQVDVWVGLDVGKKEHFADVLDNDGEGLFARAVANSQADLETLLDRASRHGTPGLVIDQPGSIAQLALAVAARRGTPVAYVPGLVMRRAADLYPGEAKTDRRDAYVLADTARTRRKQVHWLDTSSDELLAQLRVLNGFDIDLAADATRLANRLRDALTSISPALERAVGDRLGQPGVRDLLAKYPTLTALRAASQSRIERTVKARSPRIAAKVTTAIAAVLAAQDVTVPAEAATGRVISELAAELDRVTGRRDALAGEIEEAFLSHPSGELLASMPGIGPRTGAASSPKSATAPPSPAAASSPPTPAWPRSPASPAPPSTPRPAAAEATTGSRTPCSSPRSPPCATPHPKRSTTANAPKANATTPPSSAWPAAAATSSSPCSAPATPTSPPAPQPASPKPPEPSQASHQNLRTGLTKNMGTPPHGMPSLSGRHRARARSAGHAGRNQSGYVAGAGVRGG